MCIVCGYPDCTCPPVKFPPCLPCEEDSGCNPKVPAKCVTINDTNVEVLLECNNFLDYIYNCLIANPAQYQKFCLLWDGCNTVCIQVEIITVAADPTTLGNVIVTWNTVAGDTYDIYLDNVLVQSNVTSPHTLSSVTFGVLHTVKVVNHCPNGATNFSEKTFNLCTPATDFAVNEGLSDPNNALVEWTALPATAYDLYKDNVLVQVGASSPYVYTGLTPTTDYVFKIVSRCVSLFAQPIPTFYEINYTTQS